MTTRDGWDDARLSAAFAAMATTTQAPADLATRIVAAVRSARVDRSRRPWPWPGLLPTAAALGAVAASVVIAVALIGVLSPDGPVGPAGPAGSATPRATVSVAPTPRAVFGLAVLSVAAAIDIRGAGADDREIAVRGWFSPPPDMYCPLMLATSPVQPDCRDHQTFLMSEPESLITDTGSRAPVGPWIHIDLDALVSGWWPELPGDGPVDILVIGHFDDRRSTACPPYVEPECRDRFVVDRVDSVDGASMPLSIENPLGGQTASTLDQVEAIVESEAPASPILSIVVVDGPFLGEMEPTLKDGAGGFTANPVIWVVRVLEAERVFTYLVIDGSDEIYEVGSDDEAVSPEDPATFGFPLTGVPDRPVPFEVVDLLEMVEEAREATPAEMSRPWPATDGLRIENLASDTVLVRWTGGVCDRRPRLTVAPDPIPGGRHHGLHLSDARPACDAMGIGRGIVLHFKISYGARDLVGTEEIELVEP